MSSTDYVDWWLQLWFTHNYAWLTEWILKGGFFLLHLACDLLHLFGFSQREHKAFEWNPTSSFWSGHDFPTADAATVTSRFTLGSQKTLSWYCKKIKSLHLAVLWTIVPKAMSICSLENCFVWAYVNSNPTLRQDQLNGPEMVLASKKNPELFVCAVKENKPNPCLLYALFFFKHSYDNLTINKLYDWKSWNASTATPLQPMHTSVRQPPITLLPSLLVPLVLPSSLFWSLYIV